MNFPLALKKLFWDTEVKNVGLKNRQFVIARVTEKGTVRDWQWLVKTFGKKVVKAAVKNSRNVSAKTKNFWHVI